MSGERKFVPRSTRCNPKSVCGQSTIARCSPQFVFESVEFCQSSASLSCSKRKKIAQYNALGFALCVFLSGSEGMLDRLGKLISARGLLFSKCVALVPQIDRRFSNTNIGQSVTRQTIFSVFFNLSLLPTHTNRRASNSQLKSTTTRWIRSGGI